MLIETREVTRVYQMGNNLVTALDHVTMGVIEGEFVAIQGTSGSGKSTLFDLIYTMFYGRLKSLNAISTPDDFDFLVASDPIVVFDNQFIAVQSDCMDIIIAKIFYNLFFSFFAGLIFGW